jgi:hypothetical protein
MTKNHHWAGVVRLMPERRKEKGWEQWTGVFAWALHWLLAVEREQIRAQPVYRSWEDSLGEVGDVGSRMKKSHSFSA